MTMCKYTAKQIQRFWSKVVINADHDKCWEWIGSRKKCGYGQLVINYRPKIAHRVSWEITNGTIPEGLHVCHSCDNPFCCNPAHLFLGTPLDNVRDMMSKGRKNPVKGENHPQCKLTSGQVQSIRHQYAMGMASPKELAKQMNISLSHIYRIIKREKWREGVV